jgi:hypothetical protein
MYVYICIKMYVCIYVSLSLTHTTPEVHALETHEVGPTAISKSDFARHVLLEAGSSIESGGK